MHFILKDEVISKILYSVNTQLFLKHIVVDNVPVHPQSKGYKSSKPHREHPGHLKMTSIAKPHPINNSSVRGSTMAH